MNKPAIYMYVVAALCSAACTQSRPAVAQAPAVWAIAPVASRTSAPITMIRVRGKIQPGWHVYSITQPAGGPTATRISIPEGQPFVQAGDVRAVTQPLIEYDDAFKMKVQLHEKSAEFLVPVRTTRPLVPADSIHVSVRYQVCNASLCYPPRTEKLVASIPAPRN